MSHISAPSSTPTQVTIRCQGILFDMDGILISSLGSVERSWTKWALMRDIDPAYALSVIHGRRSIETIAFLRPDLDAEAENRIVEELEIEDKEGVEVLPGVRDLLAKLNDGSGSGSNARQRWTVVTSATRALAQVRLGLVGLPVPEQFITADDVKEGKPHPAPYLAGSALLGFAPQDCVVFEDAESGTKAGRAAGCTVIATTFSHSPESLAAAHYLIPDLTVVDMRHLSDDQGMELSFSPLAR